MFAQFVQPYWTALNDRLQDIVRSELPDEPGFGAMVRYAMGWENEDGSPYDKLTGKRLRPALLLMANQSAGGQWTDALDAAASVELLHNFSLIHDDIQDNSPIRHNRPTVWRVWGVANAINAGDAMFALAYASMAKMSDVVSPEVALRLWAIFNRTNLELTRGQHLDMRFEQLERVSVDDYISMLKGKTGSLLSACAEMGALTANGNEKQASKYGEFGLNMGIAFQIRDDILGIWGNSDVTGKSAATDIQSKKKSLPVLYGLTHSPELVELYQVDEFGDLEIEKAVHLLDEVQARQYAIEQEQKFHQAAMAALDEAQPDSQATAPLHEFVDALFDRTY